MTSSIQLELEAKRLPADADSSLTPHIAAACGLSADDILHYRIEKRSLDARQKPRVKLLYSLTVTFRDGVRPKGHLEEPRAEMAYSIPENRSGIRHPLIVGAGPAGLFAALVLAEAGACPVILDRGRDVARRKQDIDGFFNTRILNTESNLLFGEGGAGTWSDGKLFTRVHDPRAKSVLKAFVDAGAQPEILYFAHPHIGSDRLPGVIAAIRDKITRLGGRFLWDSRVEDIVGSGQFQAVVLNSGERLEAPAALIACGHSARTLIENLARRVEFSMKGFQLGCRIEHPQRFVNETQYGVELPWPSLGSAEYLFSTQGNGGCQGATTFCMCPGGEIIPATCDENALCTNGMSESARDGEFANSAIISTLEAGTFSTPAQAFDFLHRLEELSFQNGGGDYAAPAQNAADFLEHRNGKLRTSSSYRLGLRQARLDTIVPEPIASAIGNALRAFDRKAPGFIRNGLLVGMETRVSSPVRFMRNPDTLESSMRNLYIGGEGGGMAGGIMSAAIDGMKLAEKMLAGH